MSAGSWPYLATADSKRSAAQACALSPAAQLCEHRQRAVGESARSTGVSRASTSSAPVKLHTLLGMSLDGAKMGMTTWVLSRARSAVMPGTSAASTAGRRDVTERVS